MNPRRVGPGAAFGAAFVFLASMPSMAAFPNGIATGDVSTNSAVVIARSDVPGMVTIEYGFDSQEEHVLGSFQVPVTDPAIPAKGELTGLLGSTAYWVRATDESGASALGRFRTLLHFGIPSTFRFGVTGDWRGELAPYPAVANMPERDLDLLIKLGDTIYADYPTPDLPLPQAETLEEYRIKHNEVYSERYGRNVWAEVQANVAVLATIDDHEVTNDFAGGADPTTDDRFDDDVPFINETTLFANGLQAFHDYNPIREEYYEETGDPRTSGKRKLYRERTAGKLAAFFVLDARSFRDLELPAVENPLDPQQIGAFLVASFDPSRTMLADQQIEDLKADLLEAQSNGVTWKFVVVPEPIQNLGVIGASDRFEGYAAERTELISFIETNGIENVVWITADIHGTLVNNLTYSTGPFDAQIPTSMWEISTGSVAFDAPFGPTVALLAFQFGLLSQAEYDVYLSLPRQLKDEFIRQLTDIQVTSQGYDPLGLTGSEVPAQLLEGSYAPTHTFGWTEFEIDPLDRSLLVTTYGIDAYTQDELDADPDGVLSRVPEVVSKFLVIPQETVSASEPASAPRLSIHGSVSSADSDGISKLHLSLAESGQSTVEIYDVRGAHVASLFRGSLVAGTHVLEWDGAMDSGRQAPPGLYLIKASMGRETATTKLIRVR